MKSAATGIIFVSFCLLVLTEQSVSADDGREPMQLQQPANVAAVNELDSAEAPAMMMNPYVPDASAWLQLQALKQRAAVHEAQVSNLGDRDRLVAADIPEKRHLCRAKYVYNPVSGKCQPSLSALRQGGRR